jgi:hypothetical protein
MECFENIIGLSQVVCPCIEGDIPEGCSTSKTGLFLSDLAPLDELVGMESTTCGQDSIWAVMDRARSEAISQFATDASMMLRNRVLPRRSDWKGRIGEVSGTAEIVNEKQYLGVRIDTKQVRGGALLINEVGGLFSANGSVIVSLYNALGEQLYAKSIDTKARKHTGTSVNWLLPLDDKLEYFLVYKYNQDNAPIVNKTVCSCTGWKPFFNSEQPQYLQAHSPSRGWANWLQIEAWSGDELEFTGNGTNDAKMNGLTISAKIECSYSSIFCAPLDSIDISTNPVAMGIGFAIRYKAAAILAGKILKGTKLNRLQMTHHELLLSEIKSWNSMYYEHLEYIADNVDLSANDCYTCKPRLGMSMKTILT